MRAIKELRNRRGQSVTSEISKGRKCCLFQLEWVVVPESRSWYMRKAERRVLLLSGSWSQAGSTASCVNIVLVHFSSSSLNMSSLKSLAQPGKDKLPGLVPVPAELTREKGRSVSKQATQDHLCVVSLEGRLKNFVCMSRGKYLC